MIGTKRLILSAFVAVLSAAMVGIVGTQAGAKPSVSVEVEECGEATLTFLNPTDWKFVFDYRVDGEDPLHGAVLPGVTMSGGPFAGEEFGPRYHLVIVDGREGYHEESVNLSFAEGSGTHTVAYRLAEGAEQNFYLDWETVEVQACEEEQSPASSALASPKKRVRIFPPTTVLPEENFEYIRDNCQVSEVVHPNERQSVAIGNTGISLRFQKPSYEESFLLCAVFTDKGDVVWLRFFNVEGEEISSLWQYATLMWNVRKTTGLTRFEIVSRLVNEEIRLMKYIRNDSWLPMNPDVGWTRDIIFSQGLRTPGSYALNWE